MHRWIKMGEDRLRLETEPMEPNLNFRCDLCSRAIRKGQMMAQYYSGEPEDVRYPFVVILHAEHLECLARGA